MKKASVREIERAAERRSRWPLPQDGTRTVLWPVVTNPQEICHTCTWAYDGDRQGMRLKVHSPACRTHQLAEREK